MKKILLFSLLLLISSAKTIAQGFAPNASSWTLPAGGQMYNGTNYSFINLSYNGSFNDDDGSQAWTTTDINGDGKLDLIVFRDKVAGNWIMSEVNGTKYWKVYLNTGTGFSNSPINFTLPAGGQVDNGTNYGFFNLTYNGSFNDDDGSQAWTTTDINGDGKLDLIVFRDKVAGNWVMSEVNGTKYWKVYLNTGTGFSNSPTNWTLPAGGQVDNGTNYSFFNLTYNGSFNDDDGSQSWTTTDMNGDGKPDLVVFRDKVAGNWIMSEVNGTKYWKVYLNTGAGFSNSPTNFTLPAGGQVDNGTNYSFFNLTYNGSFNDDDGSQAWTTTDINGDGKLDLIVFRDKVAGNWIMSEVNGTKYWKVYLNTGTGFSNSPTNFTLPAGGQIYNGTNYGFFDLNYTGNVNDDDGTQRWITTDIDGDSKMDLVAYQEKVIGQWDVPGPAGSKYWKVYLNTTNGFSNTALNWALPPNGGEISNGVNYGFTNLYNNGTGNDDGSQAWATIDINGDKKMDLVAYRERVLGMLDVPGTVGSRYWKVYINNSTVGIQENSTADSEVSVFPNPFTDKIIVRSNTANEIPVQVFHSTGSLIYSSQTENKISEINLAKHAAGIYFIKIGSETKKLVKE